MKKMKTKALLTTLCLFLGSTFSFADTAIGLKASTLGAGVEVTTNVVPLMLNARLLVSGFNYDKSIAGTDADYDAALKLQSAGLIADFYPFAGKFRISAGAFYNGNKFTLSSANGTINGATFNTLNGEITFNTFAPYVGLGFGDAVSSGSPIGFNIEVGALLQGAPKASLAVSGGLASAADVAAEEQKLNDSLSAFKAWPVIAVGISYKF